MTYQARFVKSFVLERLWSKLQVLESINADRIAYTYESENEHENHESISWATPASAESEEYGFRCSRYLTLRKSMR
jgi:hypothetical protein